MSQRLFGTDGIRGVANEPPLTPDLAYRVGRELVATLLGQQNHDGPIRLVIGRDTRRSGPLLEAAMVAGLLSAGADCYTVGVLPTPGIALMTRALDAQGGIVLIYRFRFAPEGGPVAWGHESGVEPFDALVAARDQSTPGSYWWALVVSNHRPPPCKGEAKAKVTGLHRPYRVPLSAFETL